jgi:hypothetical protein
MNECSLVDLISYPWKVLFLKLLLIFVSKNGGHKPFSKARAKACVISERFTSPFLMELVVLVPGLVL